ncbi:PAX3- and PAX7-binding protein 1 [Toxocara canis]|uniref:PAX3-and PAX7-binding protein 1 n=1 Tax=Toxocara canis TaxID=6265 RepID=A0A0B2VU31_TOXCA|nr:PAX3- and PAX7-binding protein 1 [Toxocara canis]
MERLKEETPPAENDVEDETTRSKFPTTFGQIPDAQAVYEARKKREKMRLSGFSSGRIPLDDVQKLKDKSVARSRLIREDDNDMSDEDDEAGRFYSSKTLVLNEEERRRSEHSQFLAFEQGDDENEQSDDELSRWESEQIKKGVSSYKVELLERERKRMTEMMRAMVAGQGYGMGEENNEPQPMDVEMDIDVSIQEPEVIHDAENEQSDDELSRWESEQIKKGVSSYKVELLERERKRMTEMMRAMVAGQGYGMGEENNEPQPMDVEMDIDVSIQEPEVIHDSGQRSVRKTSNVTLDGILSKLRLRIKDRDEVLNAREAELERVEKNIIENKDTMTKLRVEEPRLQELFTMYQEIRAYSRDLLECLSEKVDEIKNLECRVFSVLNVRAQRIRKRRRQDVHDVYDECSAAAAGKNINTMRAPNVTQRAAEREARRARRRRNRENTLEGVSHEDGLSSDDEETNSEMAATQLAIKEVTEAAQVVFVDVLEDFCRIDKILSRFIDWLALDETSFTDAYIQLCIPKLLSPFIRLELITWNPLEGDDRPLHVMHWYEDLLACGSSNADLSGEHEIIVSLIPLCIERTIIPRIADIVQEQWDPLSQKQCSRLGFLLDSLVDECPNLVPSSRSVKRLLETIRHRVQEAIDEDLFVPIYSKQAVENASTGCKVFLDRQFWTAVKMEQLGDSVNAASDKRHVTRKLDQLLAGLRQILDLRRRLDPETQEQFDLKIEPIRMQIQSVVNTLSLVCAIKEEEDTPTSNSGNIYADYYEQQSSAALPEQQQMKSQREIEADAMRLRAEQAKADAEESRRLAADIEDLNEIMLDLGRLVHSQHEIVDSIEENVERSRLEIQAGHKHLKKAQAAQSAKYPLVAAAVGSVALGGPVGLAAGSTVAGVCAALGGAIAGLYGGRFFKKKAQDVANRE